jgi:hypothetical protein
MASVISWTLLLAVCMLVLQGVIELIENRVLRYRPAVGEHRVAKPILGSGKD